MWREFQKQPLRDSWKMVPLNFSNVIGISKKSRKSFWEIPANKFIFSKIVVS